MLREEDRNLISQAGKSLAWSLMLCEEIEFCFVEFLWIELWNGLFVNMSICEITFVTESESQAEEGADGVNT